MARSTGWTTGTLSPPCATSTPAAGAPHGKTVLGLSVVAWYDRGAGEWRVFDDTCPHRLAPLSEGRIDGKGRLQCVYHGWCFDGAGACKFIPQAPALGPPVRRAPPIPTFPPLPSSLTTAN